jgi:Tfp pilus assembly protein PilF
MNDLTARLETLLETNEETALLRFSLGNAYLKSDPDKAVQHLARAVELDPGYSAAWKLLGAALAEDNRPDEARDAYERGISVAEENGDIQAAKEMRVFLTRLAG